MPTHPSMQTERSHHSAQVWRTLAVHTSRVHKVLALPLFAVPVADAEFCRCILPLTLTGHGD